VNEVAHQVQDVFLAVEILVEEPMEISPPGRSGGWSSVEAFSMNK
jgi:hypothetical protein